MRPCWTTRSRTRGCCSWPRPATTASTSTATRAPAYPAASTCRTSSSVAAIDHTGGSPRSRTTARRRVDIAAPGTNILSTYPPTRATRPGLGLARRDVDGGAARERASPPWSPRSARRWPADPTALKARLLATGKPLPRPPARPSPGGSSTRSARSTTSAPVAAAPIALRVRGRGTIVGDAGQDPTSAGRPATDDRTGVGALQARVSATARTRGRRPSRDVEPHDARRATLTFGTAYAFRVRARDGAGNWGAFVDGAAVTPMRYQETSSRVDLQRHVARATRAPSASGGHDALRDARGRRRSRSGSPAGPSRSSRRRARPAAARSLRRRRAMSRRSSLYRSSRAPRVVVAARSWSTLGRTHGQARVVGTAGHPRVDVDAFAIADASRRLSCPR